MVLEFVGVYNLRYDGNDVLLRKFVDGQGIYEPVCMIDVARLPR